MEGAEPTNWSKSDSSHRLVIVTGPAGAGRSTAINVLEDFGFEAIDNMPLSLVPRLLSGPASERPLAIGVDARTRDFSAEALWSMVQTLGTRPGVTLSLLYVDCAPDTLLRRFSETRRRHPLSEAETPRDGIEKEALLLAGLRSRADILVDTSELSPHDLKAELAQWFAQERSDALAVSVQSFSFKRGTPRGLDMVYDVRFLRNPHWDQTLKPFDGRDQAVADYIKADPRYGSFLEKLTDLVTFLLPAYQEEGKSYVSIGMGCTGGQHRSVHLTEVLANSLAQAGWRVSTRHRELERRQSVGATKAGVA
ncbi:MAG: RNase adapter RapZ [Pseudomonadota bacterium]